MTYQFENDIFISYAHIDDQALTQGEKGWIFDFHRALELRLGELLGEPPRIWRDLKLEGNDYFSDIIVEQFLKVALLISVLSPRYVKSEWCMRELREFYKAAEHTGGVRVGDKARIFKVVKTYIPLEEHPQELQALLGYEFYEIDRSTGRPHDFIKIFGPEAERNYWVKLYDLAYDIRQLLVIIKKSKEGSVEPVPPLNKTTIYLAETTFDLNNERDKIKRELQQRGYIVLPDQPLPLNAPDFQKVVCENLERCTLSIHLIGKKYGIIPEGADKSVIELQNELAAARSQEDPTLSRLIWMPVGLRIPDEETHQQKFIKYLQDDPSAQKGAELVQNSLEDLKTIIQDTLRCQQNPPETPIGPLRIYLIHEQQDFEDIKPLADYLFDQKSCEVIFPLLEGDITEIRQYHQDNLCLCDAFIIYYGKANERWLQVQIGELRKVASYGRLKPMLAAVYVASPETPQKQHFRTREALTIIKNFALFSPDLLEQFFTQIAQGQGGQR